MLSFAISKLMLGNVKQIYGGGSGCMALCVQEMLYSSWKRPKFMNPQIYLLACNKSIHIGNAKSFVNKLNFLIHKIGCQTSFVNRQQVGSFLRLNCSLSTRWSNCHNFCSYDQLIGQPSRGVLTLFFYLIPLNHLVVSLGCVADTLQKR